MYITFKQAILAFIYTVRISEGTASTIYIKLIRQGLKKWLIKTAQSSVIQVIHIEQ